jgi:hypothetical protein
MTQELNRRDVRRAVENLPTELDDAYDEAMQRIESQDNREVNLAKQVLCCISYAFRPLTVTEVQHGLAIEPGDVDLDEEVLSDEDDLVSLCAGLVTTDRESNVIRLVHYTTQQYFERIRMTRFPDAQTSIATTCLVYISFDTFAKGHCRSDLGLEFRLRKYPLLEYAAQHWGDHAREDSEEAVKELALKFLEHNSKLLCSNQIVHLPRYQTSKYSQSLPKGGAGLHISASFGLEEITRQLLERGADVATKDSDE